MRLMPNQPLNEPLRHVAVTLSLLLVFSTSCWGDPPSPPTVSLRTVNDQVIAEWAPVYNAKEYMLYYAKAPYKGPETIKSLKLGERLGYHTTHCPKAAHIM